MGTESTLEEETTLAILVQDEVSEPAEVTTVTDIETKEETTEEIIDKEVEEVTTLEPEVIEEITTTQESAEEITTTLKPIEPRLLDEEEIVGTTLIPEVETTTMVD